jgi:hypothetical protein
LKFVLEQGLSNNDKTEMQRRVFDRFGMTNTGIQWRWEYGIEE